MLGLPDASILVAYLFSIGSAVLCVVYGIINWNKDNDGNTEGNGK